MIKFEKLVEINQKLESVPVKNKNYVMVNERVKGFRELCPNGSISTEIISLENGVITVKATVADETGAVLGTGLAQEKETSSFINKTSFVENAETSAVGRALGFVGIGVDGSMASADEVANAIMNQAKISEKDLQRLEATLNPAQKQWAKKHYKVKNLSDLTIEQYADIFFRLREKENGK